ncbi:MAG: hypothetical protein AAB451_03935 [Patescibacteria group bacterium]
MVIGGEMGTDEQHVKESPLPEIGTFLVVDALKDFFYGHTEMPDDDEEIERLISEEYGIEVDVNALGLGKENRRIWRECKRPRN